MLSAWTLRPPSRAIPTAVLESAMAEKPRSKKTRPPARPSQESSEPRADRAPDAASFDPHQALGGAAFAGPLESGAAMAVGDGAASPAALEQEGVDRRA